MSKKCELTGKTVMTGNNRSHAENKTRRRFLPNLQKTALWSEVLGESVRLRLSVSAVRTVEHAGGIDTFLASAPVAELSPTARRLKKRVVKALATAQANAA